MQLIVSGLLFIIHLSSDSFIHYFFAVSKTWHSTETWQPGGGIRYKGITSIVFFRGSDLVPTIKLPRIGTIESETV